MSITTRSKTTPHMASKKTVFFVQIGPLNYRPLLFDPHRSTVTILSRSFLSDCITHGGRTAGIHSRWVERELTNRKRHQHHWPGVSKKPERYMPQICIHTEKYTPSLQGNGSRWHYRSRSCLCSMEIITLTVKQFLIQSICLRCNHKPLKDRRPLPKLSISPESLALGGKDSGWWVSWAGMYPWRQQGWNPLAEAEWQAALRPALPCGCHRRHQPAASRSPLLLRFLPLHQSAPSGASPSAAPTPPSSGRSSACHWSAESCDPGKSRQQSFRGESKGAAFRRSRPIRARWWHQPVAPLLAAVRKANSIPENNEACHATWTK